MSSKDIERRSLMELATKIGATATAGSIAGYVADKITEPASSDRDEYYAKIMKHRIDKTKKELEEEERLEAYREFIDANKKSIRI